MKTVSIIFLAAALLLCKWSNGQPGIPANTTVFGANFAIRAGINFQNLNGKGPTGDKLENNLKIGYNIGATAEWTLVPDYIIQPGLLFSTKGAKLNNDNGRVSLSYLEIPVNFIYKPLLGTNRILIGFGPYAAVALDGKFKSNGVSADIQFKNTVSSSELLSRDLFFRRFDAGANLLAGYELTNRLSFQLNAQLGLVKINSKIENNNTDKSSIKNTGFGISAAYRF